MGRIVVGIDGSTSSRRALVTSLRMAEINGDLVDVVHAWEPITDAPYAHREQAPSERAQEHAAWSLLANELDAIEREAEIIDVRSVVTRGRPSAVLIDIAKGARFVALGTGHTSLTATGHLGSVALEVVRHAPCPVVLVPPVSAIEFLNEGNEPAKLPLSEYEDADSAFV